MTATQQIVETTSGLFLRYGIRSVTMSDIASQLGMSKKTLYQSVATKAELVELVIGGFVQRELDVLSDIRSEAKDPIDEILKIALNGIRTIRKVSPSIVYDLQKYHRPSWALIESFHRAHIYQVIQENIITGQEEGIYRKSITPSIIAKFYVNTSMLLADEDTFPQKDYKKDQLIEEFIEYHIYGIASPKGAALLEQHLVQVKAEEGW